MEYQAKQERLRKALFTEHQKTLDTYWDEDGRFCWAPNKEASGGYRAILWHCLAYLAGDAHCVEKANRIILANYKQTPCHFAPGAVTDVLFHYRDRLWAETVAALERYQRLNVPFMATEDLKIHGYNDNHPFKAMHALIVGGEMIGMPELVKVGIFRLKQAVEMYRRNGFPCEFNSPNYTPVSLNPLANIVEQAQSEEARELALVIERFFWQDLALHWDSRCGLPAGPISRAGCKDYSGLLSGDLTLLSHLFPERFAFDLTEETYRLGIKSRFLSGDPHTAEHFPFYQVHRVWYASVNYHLTEAIEDALFNKPVGAAVYGTSESGTAAIKWNEDTKPADAPARHVMGPRRSLLTTYYGDGFSLGSSQYSWLANGQTHGVFATVSKGAEVRPDQAVTYYARMHYDEKSPYGETPDPKESCLAESGEFRTVQHQGTAMVFYNPIPQYGTFRRLRTGVYRPLFFSEPEELWIGETKVPTLNLICKNLAPVAINEGSVYVGIIPMRLTNLGQAREAHMQVHTYSQHLAIQMSSFEGWKPQLFRYDDIVAVNAGFVLEMHPAADFASFTAFRQWLAQAQVSDHYYADMRTTAYTRPGLELSACYSPYHSSFRHATINGVPVAQDPCLRIEGMPDPGYGLNGLRPANFKGGS
ncbi:MAG: hypothetical protein WC637_18420 [Victivallales bacterium]|jgi:hypothetical protein